MAEFPAIPLWTDSYLADCSHLSDAEHGRYMLILIAMWRSPECRLPNDDEWLARKFRRTVEQVREQLRPIIAEFCKTDGNWIWQERLLRERQHVKKSSKKQSDRAKSRWNKDKDESRGNATHGTAAAMPPTPTPTPHREENSAREIIEDFDRERIEVFGEAQARLYPNSLDLVEANRWIAEGATREICRSVFRARFARQKAEGKRPSDTLGHMAGSIADALASSRLPMASGVVSPGRGVSVDLDRILGPVEASNGH